MEESQEVVEKLQEVVEKLQEGMEEAQGGDGGAPGKLGGAHSNSLSVIYLQCLHRAFTPVQLCTTLLVFREPWFYSYPSFPFATQWCRVFSEDTI